MNETIRYKGIVGWEFWQDGDTPRILETTETGKRHVGVFNTPEEARLAAAAPELAEALKAMVEAFVRHPGNHDERHHALTIARAALEKAGLP